MRDHDPGRVKAELLARLQALASAAPEDSAARLGDLYRPDATWLGSHPINRLHGIEAVEREVWAPLRRAFGRIRRRDDILMGGRWKDADWVSATGYLHGTFVEDWLGIPATRNWAYLRYGEFHRVEGGRIAASFVILDVLDLMRQAGVFPWRPGLGVETLMPGPATGDGILLEAQDPARSAASLKLVEAMIFDGLQRWDRASSASMGMDRFWTPDMMWYGPGGIGATRGLGNFLRFHQEPWQEGIPEGKGGDHVARFGDGDYVASTGWPSIRAVHGGEFFDLPASGTPLQIRVMDWWHRAGGLLDENWIFIDLPDMFLQLGVDLFARMAELREQRRAVPRRLRRYGPP